MPAARGKILRRRGNRSLFIGGRDSAFTFRERRATKGDLDVRDAALNGLGAAFAGDI